MKKFRMEMPIKSRIEKKKKLWYVQILKYYKVIKTNQPQLYKTLWINLKNLILSEKKPDTKYQKSGKLVFFFWRGDAYLGVKT